MSTLNLNQAVNNSGVAVNRLEANFNRLVNAVLENDNRRNTCHAEAPGEGRRLVNINFCDLYPAVVFVCNLLDKRLEHFARSAPIRIKIN